MKLSLKWIKEYVEIPKTIELSKLVHDLTMSTVEVEGWTNLSDNFDKMVVGEIKEVLPHPDADKLRVCKVDIGNEIKTIVCGGINLEVGMKVAVSLPGAMVRWHGEGELAPIGIAKVRGVESYGMICASSEIGLGDLFPEQEDGEIVDLSLIDAPAGTMLAEALELDDVILEIDNKSLTNRPDLWGHFGIAREISAIYDLPMKEIEPYELVKTKELEIEIQNADLCPRYIGVKIEGVKVEPSSFDIQKKLWSVGMRPINAIVDITNYVMLVTGQPTHAFDADSIKDGIIVRNATESESLTLLDNRELSLGTSDLVIADHKGAIALAGVMGGEKDSILPETTALILEVANFNPLSIRQTMMRYEARTEAATRYEKGIDPERCDLAMALSMNLLSQQYPEMKVISATDNYPKPLEKVTIEVSLEWLERRLGKKIPNEKIISNLEKLGFIITLNNEVMKILVPSWRATGDVSLPEDILEEVARIHGYDNFEQKEIYTSFEESINQLEVDIDRKIREYLAIRCGMQEVFTYPWVHNDYLEAIHGNIDGMLSLSAPPTPEEKYIRSSLLPNLCKAVAGNLRYKNEFAIFESANVFFNNKFISNYNKEESLPLQHKTIAGALVGEAKEIDLLFRKTKGIVENLSLYVHMEALTFEQKEKPSWADATVWLNIKHNNKIIGHLGLLSKKSALACGIKNSFVMLFELDIEDLKLYPSRTNEFKALPEYPVINYDLSLVVDTSVKWDDMLQVINEKQDKLIQNITYIGEYSGKQVPEGKKSVSLKLTIGSNEKTLTSDEIDNTANAIIKALNKKLGAELRS